MQQRGVASGLGRQCWAEDTGDALQKLLNAGGHARAAAHWAVDCKYAVGQHLAARSRGTQFVQVVWLVVATPATPVR